MLLGIVALTAVCLYYERKPLLALMFK
jgi:hypothetical protein